MAALYRRNRPNEEEQDSGEVCCPLPFPLQDLCLLAIVSNLDRYQVDLIALLPLKIRQRLLSILPALDLCRLEHTPVADGVDISEIWKSRPALEPVSSNLLLDKSKSSFQLNVCAKSSVSKAHGSCAEIKEALKLAFDDKMLSQGKEIVFAVVSEIIATAGQSAAKKKPEFGLSGVFSKFRQSEANSEALQKMTTVDGKLVFSNLLSGCMHQPCKTSHCGERVWKTQATAMDVKTTQASSSRAVSLYDYLKNPQGSRSDKVLLSPRYRQFTLDRSDDTLKLVSSLYRDCTIQPSSAFVHVDFIYSLVFPQCLSLDGGSGLSPVESSWISTLNGMLRQVSILKLNCDDYSNMRIMVGLLEEALQNSLLKYLFCSIPNLYLDLVQPFRTLFSLQNFRQLALELDKLSLFMFCRVIHEFMTVECSHEQELLVHVKNDPVIPYLLLQPNQLASLYKDLPSLSLPSALAQYKILELNFKDALFLLFQLPTIRLKEITLPNLDYLHLCTLHPDLHTTKIVIDLSSFIKFSTIQADLISVFKMSSLQEVVVSGNWGGNEEVKSGLVDGLRRRSRSFPLKKVALELARSDHYKMYDFQLLCEAIFSLPNLKELEVVFGKGFGDIIRQKQYEGIVYKSWNRTSSGVKLKSICIQILETELKKVSLTTQKLFFEWKPREHREYYDDESADLWFGDLGDYFAPSYGYGYGYDYDTYDGYYSDDSF